MINWFKKMFSSKKSTINVLIELNSFDKGGLEKVVLDMALRLNPDIFKPIIVSVGRVGYLYELAIQKGLRAIALNQNDPINHFRNILEKEKIHIGNSHFSRFGYPFYKEKNIPNITFIHNVYAFLSEEEIQNIKNDDSFVSAYISVSKNATRYAIQKLGLQADKFFTIPNGLIIEEHEERLKNAPILNRKVFHLNPEDYVFVNVASYNLHKGHYLMADAMKKILAVRNDIKIICLGNVIFPPHADGFRQYLKDYNLENHILMPGYFPYVESFYQITDAFLLPSFIEGWSIAMNEAMFYEKPMILSNTGASAEVIENNDIGILVENEYGDILNLNSKLLDSIAYDQREFKTSQQLANAMISFADHREYWKAAGKKAKKKVIEKFNFDHIVRQYEEVFMSVSNTTKRKIG